MSDLVVWRPIDALRELLARPGVFVVLLAVAAEIALLAGYLGLTGATATSIRYLLYPFVWIDLALWAVFAVDPPATSRRARRIALVGAALYLAVLAYAGGLVGLELFGGHVHATEVAVSMFTKSPPGYGPVVLFETPRATLTLVPYKVIGYIGLAYLTYTAVLDTAASALSGAVGLLSCVSCTWPVFASLLAAVLGGEVVATSLYQHSMDLSTVAFVVATALLVWRPGAG